ncbi:hypothetical protein Tdes44962_MAKER04880 [Teratosphaeria destructans]|uniref:DH domain-containing protein n=1 Tax=Teratosphaeria destructans TaxID=418781 RepID=A0A9W7SLD0_9PEZI|nr:hypothetical protein Tdes44962_MAKER04880 [Teratosphaeria destructans]
MPAPNAGTKNGVKKTPEKKGAELKEATLARRKSQDFASKIQGWDAGNQMHDEVVVVEEKDDSARSANDIVEVIVDVPESSDGVELLAAVGPERERTSPTRPKTPGDGTVKPGTKPGDAAKASRQLDLERKAWVRRKSKPQAEIPAEVKEATTPKKRVVSDGHWRREKIAKPEKTSPDKEKEKDTTPKPVTIRRSVVSVGLKVPPSVADFVEEQEAPVKVRAVRSTKSRSRSRDRNVTPDYEDSGVKVYIKRRRRDEKAGTTSDSSFTTGTVSSFEKQNSSATDLTTPERSPTKAMPPRPSTAPRERKSRRSLDAVREARHVSRFKTAATERHEEPSLETRPLSTSVAKAAPVVVRPSSKGGRIDNWLAGTSDPFVDRDSSVAPEPLEIPKRKSRRRLDEDPRDEDDSERRASNGRRRRSRPSLEPIDIERSRARDLSPLSTPTLRRSTARRHTHSPVKERGSGDVRLAADARTVSDAILKRDISRHDFARPAQNHGRRLATIKSADTLSSKHQQGAMSDTSEQLTVVPEGSVLSRASDGDQAPRHGGGLKRRLTKTSDLVSVLSRDDGRALRPARRSTRGSRRRADGGGSIADAMNELTTDELKYYRELRTLVDGVIPVLLTYVLQKTDATGTKRLFSGSSPAGQAVTRPIVEMGVALEKLKATHKRIPLHDADELLRWAENASKHYVEYLKSWRLGFQDVMVTLAPADESDNTVANEKKGEKVDVAYLLKRPLVRLKYLAKSFKAIDQQQPSEKARALGDRYYELVQEARQRNNDERARLEDEAAASIDPTRARDPKSFAPLAGVTIDPTRSVRARDYFDMDLTHSSGQQLLCKIEVILRDDAPGRGSASDLLFCEVSIAGRWLLFPPIPASYVSARPGDADGEIVVMVRGMLAGGKEWRELMTLKSDDEAAIDEWLSMLSTTPVPAKLNRVSSFNELRGAYMSGGLGHKATSYRPPSPSEIDFPLGEPATDNAQQWDGSEVNSTFGDMPAPSLRRMKAKKYRNRPASPISEDSYEQVHARANRIAEQERYSEDERSDIDSQPRLQYRPQSAYQPSQSRWTETSSFVSSSYASTPRKDYSVWLPTTDGRSDDSDSADEDDRPLRSRPSMHRRTSSVPSMDMPSIPKQRSGSATPRQTSDKRNAEPGSAPSKLQRRTTPPKPDQTPQPKPKSTSLGLRSGLIPSLTPAFLRRNRRPSSPLKHEYEPSTASESMTDSDLSDSDDDAESVTSKSSAEDGAAISTIGELKDFRNPATLRPKSRPVSAKSAGASEEQSAASDAPQVPSRRPSSQSVQLAKSVACIFAWADRGTWDSLHPEECSIVVTPGLIEAFDLHQAAAAICSSSVGDSVSPSQRGVRPLIALELTPLVPLRRGTALDISIRSPPTADCLLRASNNIMFRSRSPEECEKLYALINRARIDNPTYIALQNARGPVATSNWAEKMDMMNAARTSKPSFLGSLSKKSSTYRSKGSRAASTAATDSSIGTMNSAFSALRRFSGGKGVFNIAKSTLTSREGTRSTYSDSLSSGAATPLPIDPSMGTPLGITNAKIRLYLRETASKWRDMGSARMTVMLPPRQSPGAAADPRTAGLEKRIVISGKKEGEILLDVTLGEQCFERVARTGIAMSVWQDQAAVGATGGVSSASSKVFMIQLKSEREAAYTFGLVGKLRY